MNRSENEEVKLYIPKRFIVTLLSFLGFFCLFTMRVNLSVAVVAMTNSTNAGLSNNSAFTESTNLKKQEQQSSLKNYKSEQYDWDARTKGVILGAFFYGYTITQLPGGYAAESFGAKWVFGLGIFTASIFNLITPVITRSTVAFIVLRVLQGLAEGVTYPAMNCIISKWAPIYERSRLASIIYTGSTAGMVVSMPLSGWLCSSNIFGGWPAAFYILGAVGCVWFFVWSLLIYESPQVHPSISEKELSLLTSDDLSPKKLKTPWKSIFTSVPVWTLLFCRTCYDFGHFLCMTEMPSFFSSTLHFDIAQNGVLSALPYIFQALSSCLASAAADMMRKKKVLGITSIRKIFTVISLVGTASCLLGITVSDNRPWLIVTLMTVGLAVNGCIYSGSFITDVDMTPNFAGTLYGIIQTPATLCGVIAPAVVGYFTADGDNILNWNKVFYVTSGIYIAGTLVFVTFGSAEVQSWNDETPDNEKELPNVQSTKL